MLLDGSNTPKTFFDQSRITKKTEILLMRQGKARQDRTGQDKTRQDKTRQDKTRQDKTSQVTTSRKASEAASQGKPQPSALTPRHATPRVLTGTPWCVFGLDLWYFAWVSWCLFANVAHRSDHRLCFRSVRIPTPSVPRTPMSLKTRKSQTAAKTLTYIESGIVLHTFNMGEHSLLLIRASGPRDWWAQTQLEKTSLMTSRYNRLSKLAPSASLATEPLLVCHELPAPTSNCHGLSDGWQEGRLRTFRKIRQGNPIRKNCGIGY